MLEDDKELKWKSKSNFAGYSPDVDKMLWYMEHSKVTCLKMLSEFVKHFEESHTLIHTKLKREGLSYPGEDD